ncbi:chromate transporter [Cohnella lubricantis]|uniref:Chromate transporter n=1 Tax=Cohnella lubricantis TaxID=2163172 RepID=A0A841TF45_9BACL|nr:chromate transporter [Cohnella lubricantis]MBB6677091.1 chromate transporter [Cohnella lubricantis]MBP2118938.1 chromate transporter [Cohnella lubricantis]
MNSARIQGAKRGIYADGKDRAGSTTSNKVHSPPTFASIMWSFLKLAPSSFGGGYAIFPALEKEMTERRRWLGSGELAETLSLAAAAPGGVAVNASLLIGYRLRGFGGAAAAGIGAIVPTIAIVLALFFLYRLIGDTPKLRAAMEGSAWGIVALILFTAWRIGRAAIRDKFTAGLMLAALACLLGRVPPLYLIASGVLIGVGAIWMKGRSYRDSESVQEENGSSNGDGSCYMYYI